MPDFVLTRENYYDLDADRAYMSCSQYDRFNQCEAETMAYLSGQYSFKEPVSRSFFIGQYLHAAMESKEALSEFVDKNWNDVYKTKKRDKFDDILLADRMVQTVKKDPAMGRLAALPGETELIMTGSLFDEIPWRVRFDKYTTDPRCIIDWKTVARIEERFYSEEYGGYVSFMLQWGYDRRAAVYLEIERQNAGMENRALFQIACISKQNPPGRRIYTTNWSAGLDRILDGIKEKALRFHAVKRGYIEPNRCGVCAYCRRTHKVVPELFTVLDTEIWGG